MAILAVQRPQLTGTPEVMANADPPGDSFQNSGIEYIRFENGGAAKIVTIAAPGTCNFGLAHAQHNQVVNLAATGSPGANQLVGPFPPGRFNQTTNRVQWTYDSATALKVAVVSPL